MGIRHCDITVVEVGRKGSEWLHREALLCFQVRQDPYSVHGKTYEMDPLK